MSAGGLFGMFMNLFVAAGLWIILGAAVERIAKAFNATIAIMPTLQDAVNGFSLMQTVWGVIMIVIFLALVVNYLFEESNRASREV
jgi:type II secretory pathway component PulF